MRWKHGKFSKKAYQFACLLSAFPLHPVMGSPELIIHSHLPIIQIFCFSPFFPIIQVSLAYYSNNFDLLFNLYSEVGKYQFQKFSTKMKPCDNKDACIYMYSE